MNTGVVCFLAALVGCGATAAALGETSAALWCVLFLAWESRDLHMSARRQRP